MGVAVQLDPSVDRFVKAPVRKWSPEEGEAAKKG